MPVRVRVDGRPRAPWRINLMPAGDGGFYLYLHGDLRAASGTQVGDRVRIEIAFDEAYRGGPAQALPPRFALALRRNPAARRAWARQTPSRQKEIVRYLAHLKTPGALERNVRRAIAILTGTGEKAAAGPRAAHRG